MAETLMNNKFSKVVGRIVAEIRMQRELSQDELAVRAAVKANYIARLESGEHEITVQLLHRVADALGLDVSELIRRAENVADEDESVRS
jgi:transcriptional regulator with XRE-family HTH domain